MKKEILVASIIIFSIIVLLIIGWDLYVEIEPSYKGIEFIIPLICKREVITLSEGEFFDYEKLEKLYLSKNQSKRILEKIENNSNWIKGKIDENLIKIMERYSRENIYNKIPYIENKYWIFTNRSNGAKDKHSIEEVINKRMYYTVSFGVFDMDNNILYYYEYDR